MVFPCGALMKKKFILWFMSTGVYRFLIRKIIPFIRFSPYYTKFRGHKYHMGYYYLRPGHIIATIDYCKLTGILIPKVTGGISSHAALCIGKRDPKCPDLYYSTINPSPESGEGLEVVEMTHLDFTYSDFFDLCKESDRVIIFECSDWDELYVRRVIAKALECRDKKYDVLFSHDFSSLYCSELIYYADLLAGYGTPRLKADLSDLMGLGKPYISPDGLLCAKNSRAVWDSSGEFNGMTGPEIEKIIFKED